MAFIVTRLPDEPIVIAGFRLPLSEHVADIARWHAHCAHLADELDRPLIRIIHLPQQDVQFCDVLLFLDEQRQKRRGSTTDPNMRTLVVSTHPLVQVAVRQLKDQFGVEVPVFATLDAAIAHARRTVSACCPRA